MRRLGLVGISTWLTFLLLGGCVTVSQSERERQFWSSPSPISLFRGIKSGLTPSQTWHQLCRRWSFGGKCPTLRLAEQKTFPKILRKRQVPVDLRLYSFKESGSAYPCKHYFFFRSWGLNAIRSLCKIEEQAQLRSVVHRFRKLYGKENNLSRRGRTRVLLWQKQNSSKRVMLFLIGRHSIISVHTDLRLAWTRFVPKLRPILSGLSSRSWHLWGTIPQNVREELLENYSRILDRLSRLVQSRPLFPLPKTSWSSSISLGSCEQSKQADWREKKDVVWKRLDFTPREATRLQYRWNVSHRLYSRTFKLHARGCGFRFMLRVDQNGRKISLHQMKFSKRKK